MKNTLLLCWRLHPAASIAAAFLLLPLAGCGGSSSSSAPSPPANLVGTWGGGTSEAPALLTLTATGGNLAFACGSGDVLTQPLTAGAGGAFDVVATQHSSLFVPVSGVYPQVHLVGTVSGNTITLHEVDASGTGTAYTVTYSQSAPTFNGACPG